MGIFKGTITRGASHIQALVSTFAPSFVLTSGHISDPGPTTPDNTSQNINLSNKYPISEWFTDELEY